MTTPARADAHEALHELYLVANDTVKDEHGVGHNTAREWLHDEEVEIIRAGGCLVLTAGFEGANGNDEVVNIHFPEDTTDLSVSEFWVNWTDKDDLNLTGSNTPKMSERGPIARQITKLLTGSY